jgi:hypothetical protein
MALGYTGDPWVVNVIAAGPDELTNRTCSDADKAPLVDTPPRPNIGVLSDWLWWNGPSLPPNPVSVSMIIQSPGTGVTGSLAVSSAAGWVAAAATTGVPQSPIASVATADNRTTREPSAAMNPPEDHDEDTHPVSQPTSSVGRRGQVIA